MRCFLLLAVALVAPVQAADNVDRSDLLRALAGWTSAPAPLTPESRDARRPTFDSIGKIAAAHPDPELVLALCRYQLANPDPDFALPGRILGALYLAQSDTVLDVMNSLSGQDRLRLWPYLEFGWNKAIEDRNRSLPWLVQLQKKLDTYSAHLTNAATDPAATP